MADKITDSETLAIEAAEAAANVAAQMPVLNQLSDADKYVKLTPDKVSAITDHINRLAVSPDDGCPVCGSPANTVLADVYRVPVLTIAPNLGGQYQPLVSTVCHNCGFVRFFNRLIVEALIDARATDLASSSGEPKSGG